ncbi:allophanate hydrolase-related protein [Pseudanabaena mucicola]|uniref:allophanate hydrolase-related protein n=1 Tax=Pseudanabaena mucicola TaxID=71190 RepID=UPI0025761367|nr:glutamyl-tRNA amidotransferase [Pseudanabaena mucicola]
MIEFAVNGTLMRGLELNGNLQKVGATFVREDATAPIYRLWSISDRHPAMLRVKENGQAITLELWSITPAALGEILLAEPAGLCIGKIILANQQEVLGVLGEPFLCEGQKEITSYGGWRSYTAAQ